MSQVSMNLVHASSLMTLTSSSRMNTLKFGHFTTEHAEAQVPTNEAYDYTDYMKLNLAARMIRNAADGEKHRVLVNASRLCGGYIAAGKMEHDEVVRILHREICKRDIDSEDHALNTILDGIEIGKRMPIRDIIEEEKAVQREMMPSTTGTCRLSLRTTKTFGGSMTTLRAKYRSV